MKWLITAVLLTTLVVADTRVIGEVSSTYREYNSKSSDYGYSLQKDNLHNIYRIGMIGTYGDTIDYKVVASTRYEDCYLEEWYIRKTVPGNNGEQIFTVGTLNTAKGLFDGTKNASQQPPGISVPSSVYNPKWVDSGMLVPEMAEYRIDKLVPLGLLTVNLRYGYTRITDEGKGEEQIFGYVSDYAAVSNHDEIYGYELHYTIGKKHTLFTSTYKTDLSVYLDNKPTNEELYGMKTGTIPLDKSIFMAVDDKYELEYTRLGYKYEDTKNLIGYEWMKVTLDNNELDLHAVHYGWYGYYARFLTTNLSVYGWYGERRSNLHNYAKNKESVVGTKYAFNSSWLVQVEHRRTYWMSNCMLEDYESFKLGRNEDYNAEENLIQIVYRF